MTVLAVVIIVLWLFVALLYTTIRNMSIELDALKQTVSRLERLTGVTPRGRLGHSDEDDT